jgi:hypothetical protein
MILLDRRRRPVFVELIVELYDVESTEGSFASAWKEIDLWRVIRDIGVRVTEAAAISVLSARSDRAEAVRGGLDERTRRGAEDSRGLEAVGAIDVARANEEVVER